MGGLGRKSTPEQLGARLEAVAPALAERDGRRALAGFEEAVKASTPLPAEGPAQVAQCALQICLALPVETDRVLELLQRWGTPFVDAFAEAVSDFSRSGYKDRYSAAVLLHLAEWMVRAGRPAAGAMLVAPAIMQARSLAEADRALAFLREQRTSILEAKGKDVYLEALGAYLGQHATRLEQTVEVGEDAQEVGCDVEALYQLLKLGSELPGTEMERRMATARLPMLANLFNEPVPSQVNQILERLLEDRVWHQALRCGVHLLRAGTPAQPDGLRINLAICLLRLGDYGTALTVLTTPSSGPMEVQRVYHRGLCHEALGDLGQATEGYSQAVQLDPGLALAWKCRARALREAGKMTLAAEDADCLMTFDPVAGRVSSAMLALRKEAWTEAERAFSQLAGELGGLNGRQALFYRALSRHRQAKLQAAAQDYERLGEADFEPLYNLGHAYQQAGDWAAAEKAYTAALTLEPEALPALANRALVRLEGGTRDAEQDLARVKRLGRPVPVDWTQFLAGGAKRPAPFDALSELSPERVPLTARW